MVLLIEDKLIDKVPPSISELYSLYPILLNEAEEFKKKQVVECSEEYLLYVGQGEYAVIPGTSTNVPNNSVSQTDSSFEHSSSNDSSNIAYKKSNQCEIILPTVIGSDDATTCHILILFEKEVKTYCVMHIDSRKGLEESLDEIINKIEDFCRSLEQIDIYVVGGYTQINKTGGRGNCSEDISIRLLTFLVKKSVNFNIKLWCTCEANTVTAKDKPFLTSLGVNRLTGEVFPASFTNHCPAPILRNAYAWVESDNKLLDIYNISYNAVVIRPFFNWDQKYFNIMASLTDSRLLTCFSTSPLVEPPSFCSRLRRTFQLLGNTNRLFEPGKPKYYRLVANGAWIET